MMWEVNAHATLAAYPETEGWEVNEWEGSKYLTIPSNWHRYYQFRAPRVTINVFSDNWSLDYETARKLAIEIYQGKRSYWSFPLNEDNPKWRKVW